MSLNTMKTILGYIGTRITKHVPLTFSGAEVDDIFSYLQINDRISTSGQPTVEQFSSIKKREFSTVINLLPVGTSNSLANEQDIVAALGMDYVYIPVAWNNPTRECFIQFVKALEKAEDEKVWVHCASNIRVSVFIFKYRCEVIGEKMEDAIWNLREIWEPFGVWKTFLTQ